MANQRSTSPSPFEVTSQHVAAIERQMFPDLLRRLLYAEARSCSIPTDGIHVSDNIDAPDGGEDGHIHWEGEPERTDFLPGRRCMFQLKTGEITPQRAGQEVLTKAGEIKCMVRQSLTQGGNYILLTTTTCTSQGIQARKDSICKALQDAALEINGCQIHFWDASLLATWINAYPAVALRLLELAEPRLRGPFRSWDHWTGRSEHMLSDWVSDGRIEGLHKFLMEQVAIQEPRKVARISGRMGIGKSRLALETLKPCAESVMYAAHSEASDETIISTVQNLADSGMLAIVVIDQCSFDIHQKVARIAQHASSNLSVLTVGNEVSANIGDDTYEVGEVSHDVIMTIVNNVVPNMPIVDQMRIADLSADSPGCAIQIAQTWHNSALLAHGTDTEIIAEGSYERDCLVKSARLLAVLGRIKIKDGSHVARVARLGRNLSPEDLRSGLIELVRKGVAGQWGGCVELNFGQLAMYWAERQWVEWNKDTWDKVLTDTDEVIGLSNNDMKLSTPTTICIQASNQLENLNTLDISSDIVSYVCRQDGPLAKLLQDLQNMNNESDVITCIAVAKVLFNLAGVDTRVIANVLCHPRVSIETWDLSFLIAKIALKIAFKSDTFYVGARLLLRLVATKEFTSLFSPSLGSTASGVQRLELLDSVSGTDNPDQERLVVEALSAGLKIGGDSAVVGPELHGTRPSLHSWCPETKEAARAYVEGCADRLVDFAVGYHHAGTLAREALATKLYTLLSCRYGDNTFEDVVERIINRLLETFGRWTEAKEPLEEFLANYDVPPDLAKQIRAWIGKL